MQVVFTLLTLNFVIPSLSYFFAPEVALSTMRWIGRTMGAGDYPLAEQSHVWRVLAFGNVFTLGALTFLMQLDIRRYRVLGPVFVILKSCSALGYLYVYVFALRYLLFVHIFLFDALAVFLVVYFGGRAHRSLGPPGPTDGDLVPRILAGYTHGR